MYFNITILSIFISSPFNFRSQPQPSALTYHITLPIACQSGGFWYSFYKKVPSAPQLP